jgi:hypothetical protein
VETHVNKVLLGGMFFSEVDLTAFIEQDDLVENLDSSAEASHQEEGAIHHRLPAMLGKSRRQQLSGLERSRYVRS